MPFTLAIAILLMVCVVGLVVLIGLAVLRAGRQQSSTPPTPPAPPEPIRWLDHQLDRIGLRLRAPDTLQVEEVSWTEPGALLFTLPSGYTYRFKVCAGGTDSFALKRAATLSHVRRWHKDYSTLIDREDRLLYQATEEGHHYTAVLACREVDSRLWMVETSALIYDDYGAHTISEPECRQLLEILDSLASC